MRKNLIFIFLLIGFFILLGLLFLCQDYQKNPAVLAQIDQNSSSFNKSNSSHLNSIVPAKIADDQALIDNAFKTPIKLYGKVIDQHDDPVSGATIRIFPNDNPSGGSKSELTVYSDDGGKFSVEGLKGASLR
jgi:hypothetical protein